MNRLSNGLPDINSGTNTGRVEGGGQCFEPERRIHKFCELFEKSFEAGKDPSTHWLRAGGQVMLDLTQQPDTTDQKGGRWH